MDAWVLLSLVGAMCVVFVGVLTLALLLISRLLRERARRAHGRALGIALEQAAKIQELAPVSDGVFEGRIRGRRVRWTLRDVEYDHGPRLQLAFGTPVPTGQLGLTHRTISYGAVPPDLELPLCRLGDAEFDVRFFAHADLEHLSLLTPSVRRALLDAGDDAELRIRSGWLWIDHVATEAVIASASTHVEWLFKAATAFEGVQAEVEQRVRRMATDPVARVRERVLELLEPRGPSDFTTWLARSLADDVEPAVRGRAAELLGDAQRLAALARDASAPREVRRRAGRALTVIGPPDERLAVALVLTRPPHALPDVALALVADLDTAEPVLIELVQAEDGAVARSALARLGRIGSARSLVILQALVDSDARHELLRIEAKAALDALRRGARRSNPPEAAVATRTHRTPPPGADTVPLGRGAHGAVALEPDQLPGGKLPGSQLETAPLESSPFGAASTPATAQTQLGPAQGPAEGRARIPRAPSQPGPSRFTRRRSDG